MSGFQEIPTTAILRNTREILLVLQPGVSKEVLKTLLNKRRVKLENNNLIDTDSGKLLAQRVGAFNACDYRNVAPDEKKLPGYDSLDFTGCHWDYI